MLRHVTSSVTNSVTNSATPADSKEVCCQAAPEGSMHYWIDWNSCNHLTNTFYILDKSMLQFWQIHILYVKHLWHIRVTTLLLGNFEAPRTIGSTAVSDQSYYLWSSHGTLAQPQDYSFFQLLPVCLERLFFLVTDFPVLFSCPGQLNRWHCHWLTQSVRLLISATLVDTCRH